MMKRKNEEIKIARHLSVITILCGLLLVFYFQACSPHSKQPVNVIRKGPGKIKADTASTKDTKKKGNKVVWVQKPVDAETIGATEEKEPDYLMNFEEIAIPDFIEAMMTGVFKKNFLVTDAVKAIPNHFTIKMSEDLEAGKAFQLFKHILGLFNVSMTKKENTYIFDQSKKFSVTVKGPLIYGRRVPANISISDDDEVTFLIPFYNIAPGTLKALLNDQLPSRTLAFPLVEMNMLILSGNYEDIKYTLSFIDLLDRAQFKDKTILMISPEYWDIKEFQAKIEELLTAEGLNMDFMGKSGGILFIPIEKLNKLIVITPVNEWAERVLYWLDKLDIPEAAGEAKKVYAYKLKHVEVASVAEVIHAYHTGEINTTSTGDFYSKTKSSGSKFSSTSRISSSQTKNNPESPPPAEIPESSPQIPTTQKIAESEAKNGVMVIPVMETNSLIMIATPVEYKKYLDIIKKIDVPRNQVFVEVIIGEVSLDKATQLGLEFWINRYLYGTSFGTKGGLGVYKGTDTQGNNLTPAGSNFFMNGRLDNNQFEILINALVENSKINIISTPKITVLENEEAEISVGSDVPVIASETALAGGNQTTGTFYPFRSVQYINTGIILKVRAAILTDNKIGLDIEQEISEALENKKSDISSPEILKRMIKTSMVVKEGQIAFIGGLFQNKVTQSGSGIPLISKIPLIGNLFKNTKKQLKKTELVVFINAKTLRKNNDMKEIVDEVKKMFSDKINTKSEK